MDILFPYLAGIGTGLFSVMILPLIPSKNRRSR